MSHSPIFKVFLATCVLLLISGCKANLEWYLRNTTVQDVVLTLRYETISVCHRPDNIPLKRKYVGFKKELLKIDYETSSKLKDSLQVVSLNDSTYQLTLPAKSTAELTPIIPTDYAYHTNVIVEFDQNGRIYAVNTVNVFEKPKQFKMAGTLTLKNLIYYDYGAQ